MGLPFYLSKKGRVKIVIYPQFFKVYLDNKRREELKVTNNSGLTEEEILKRVKQIYPPA